MPEINNNNKNKPTFNLNWLYTSLAIFLIGWFFFMNDAFQSKSKKIQENQFFEYVEKGYVKKYVFNKDSDVVDVYLTDAALENPEFKGLKQEPSIMGQNPNMTFKVLSKNEFARRMDQLPKESTENLKSDIEEESVWMSLLINVGVWFLLLFVLWSFVFRRMGGGGGPGGQIFNIGKSRAKLYDENDKVRVSFKDVAGLEGAKEEVEEIVEFLKNPDKYTQLGGKIPKGALLVGPPGTGKTLLAKAVAGEAKVPFFSLSGSDFVEMFVGVGASRVRDLFKKAKEKSPSIIFIDEIDAIGRARGKNAMTGGNDERENTLNQLLTEMDGFGTDTNVIVLAATNRADILDKALMRAGRFDRRIYVDLPEIHERQEIFKVHTRNLKIKDALDIEFLAKQTPGFSGADIANLCNEAALIAARKGKSAIDKQDFLDAVDRIIGGLEKKGKIIKPQEKRRIAFHEAGHATVSWLLEHASPLVKVTIVPRGRSLGAAWYLPEERQITTPSQLKDEMCALLGGRAAEQVIFGDYSTGAQNDLERAFKQANAMVTIYGLSDKVGHISYYDSSGQSDYSFSKPYSEKTAELIDSEIKGLIDEQYKRCIDLLTENKDKLSQLAAILIEKEVIFRDDLEKIFGKRVFDEENDSVADTVSQSHRKPEVQDLPESTELPLPNDLPENSNDNPSPENLG
ncbi:ATP-dependent metallopeptidase FtsH/Yme1/Tma family protein [Ornithobacterium rhinotracheale]|uniref:ATP-dependent zinc metalloprotease FtsH n=1 Tax=Ornithobacterium rhinotracheale TaxID=28251 RepID=UPI00129CC3B9|nr:ATP-dependent zinc metalloprotease FtsH [Ornithobacterium rhinotracheale]MRJ08987.1 ATP-dependent metallopeptidase FtsH/Yme1/Tma family protein [Ornithobacterium rhinotracheale]UOH78885.1 ATP-dependent zinc metalloprotease FtsH [Ornithobacterium rhinotracheale]